MCTVQKGEFWKVRPAQAQDGDSPTSEGDMVLERSSLGEPLPPPPPVGALRTFGMFGQVKLIKRRTRAIARLEKHSYLLRALSAPSEVWMDTGPMELFVRLDSARDRVDENSAAEKSDCLWRE